MNIRIHRASNLKSCVCLMIEYMKTQDEEKRYKDINMQQFRTRTQEELTKVGYDLEGNSEEKIKKRNISKRYRDRKKLL